MLCALLSSFASGEESWRPAYREGEVRRCTAALPTENAEADALTGDRSCGAAGNGVSAGVTDRRA